MIYGIILEFVFLFISVVTVLAMPSDWSPLKLFLMGAFVFVICNASAYLGILAEEAAHK